MATTQNSDAVHTEIERFLQTNFPQIQMHGGEVAITEIDMDAQHAAINLSGACSGCGISPMTVQAVKTRLPKEVDAVTTVDVTTGEEDTEPTTDGPF